MEDRGPPESKPFVSGFCTVVEMSLWWKHYHSQHRNLSNDNFRCNQWWKFCQYDDISLSMWMIRTLRNPISWALIKFRFCQFNYGWVDDAIAITDSTWIPLQYRHTLSYYRISNYKCKNFWIPSNLYSGNSILERYINSNILKQSSRSNSLVTAHNEHTLYVRKLKSQHTVILWYYSMITKLIIFNALLWQTNS